GLNACVPGFCLIGHIVAECPASRPRFAPPDRSNQETHGKRRRDRIRGHGGGNTSEHHVPCAPRKRARNHCPHLREDAQELHPHPYRRQGQGGNDPVRSDQGTHHLPHEVIAVSC